MKKYFSTWVGKLQLKKRSISVEMGKFPFLVCLCVISNILGSGSLKEKAIGKDVPRFVCYKDLNFIKNPVQSGLSGNLKVWHKSFIDSKQRKPILLDVNTVHKVLCKEAGDNIKGRNKVTAALTLVFQVIDKNGIDSVYYSVTSLLSKQKRSQKKQHTDQAVKSVQIFLSGTSVAATEEEHERYFISDLYRSCLSRNMHADLNQEVRKVFDMVEKIQHLKFAFMVSMLEKRTNILEIQDKLSNFGKMLNSHWQDFVNGLSPEDELFRKKNELVRLEEEHKQDKNPFKLVENELKPNEGYGPIMDSEQHLLEYLNNNLIRAGKDLTDKKTGVYQQLKGKFTEGQHDYLHSQFSKRINFRAATRDNEMLFSQGLELSRNVAKLLPLGCILHIHSTNECCDYCATSLFYEFNISRKNSINDLRDFMKSEQEEISKTVGKSWQAPFEPFFNIAISYSKDLDNNNLHVLRPKGAFTSLGGEEQDGLISLDKDILPFKKIVNEGSLSAYTDSDGYIMPSTL